MLEESKHTEPILPEERGRTFEAQALWKRVVIVLAGPAMNVLFPIALYTSVFLEDEAVPAADGRRGRSRASPADGKLLPGDRIVRVDGDDVTSFPRGAAHHRGRAGKPVTLVGRARRQAARRHRHARRRGRGARARHRRAQGPHRASTRTSPPPSSASRAPTRRPARASLQTFDRITAVNGRRIERFVDLVDALAENRGDQVRRQLPAPRRRAAARSAASASWPCSSRARALTPMPRPPGSARPPDAQARARRRARAHRASRARTCTSAFVPEASSEWRAGLRPRRPHHDPRRRAAAALAHDGGRASSPAPTRCHELQWTRDGVPMRGLLPAPQGAVGRRVRAALRALRLPHRPLGAERARPPRAQPAPARLRAARAASKRRASVIKFISVGHAAPRAGPRVALERQRPDHDVRHRRAGGREGPRVLRLGDGAHLGQPRAHQPPADPRARRRAPALLPLRGGAAPPAAASHPRGREPGRDGRARRSSCSWRSRTTSSARWDVIVTQVRELWS